LTGQIKRFEDLPEDDYRRPRPISGRKFPAQSCTGSESKKSLARKMHPSAITLLSARQETTLYPFPEPNVANICRKTSAPDVALTNNDLARIDEVAPQEALLVRVIPIGRWEW
jgi:hypothetical protein